MQRQALCAILFSSKQVLLRVDFPDLNAVRAKVEPSYAREARAVRYTSVKVIPLETRRMSGRPQQDCGSKNCQTRAPKTVGCAALGQSLHVEVVARAPPRPCHVPQSDRRAHQCAVPVREGADHASPWAGQVQVKTVRASHRPHAIAPPVINNDKYILTNDNF
jgi:hypothetical protein